MTDAAQLAGLVRAAQRGDGLAMAELLDALAPAVGRWCGPIALQDADDAAQEAMIAILRGCVGCATRRRCLAGPGRSRSARRSGSPAAPPASSPPN